MSLTSRLARLGPSQTPVERARTADSDFYGSLSTSKTHVPEGVWPAAAERLCPSCDVLSAGAFCHRCGVDLSDLPATQGAGTAGPVDVQSAVSAPVTAGPGVSRLSGSRGRSARTDPTNGGV